MNPIYKAIYKVYNPFFVVEVSSSTHRIFLQSTTLRGVVEEAASSPGRMAMKKDKEKTMERRGGNGDIHVSRTNSCHHVYK